MVFRFFLGNGNLGLVIGWHGSFSLRRFLKVTAWAWPDSYTMKRFLCVNFLISNLLAAEWIKNEWLALWTHALGYKESWTHNFNPQCLGFSSLYHPPRNNNGVANAKKSGGFSFLSWERKSWLSDWVAWLVFTKEISESDCLGLARQLHNETFPVCEFSNF